MCFMCRKNVIVLLGHEPEGLVGTKLVNKAHGDFWEGIHPELENM